MTYEQIKQVQIDFCTKCLGSVPDWLAECCDECHVPELMQEMEIQYALQEMREAGNYDEGQ